MKDNCTSGIYCFLLNEMDRNEMEESFSHFDGITRCLVIYKLGRSRERFFWERSRNKSQLQSEVSDDIPTNERDVYNEPLHAEKYALRRLQMKIRKRHCPGYVKIYLNNSPCPRHSKWYKSCIYELKEFCEHYRNIKLEVFYSNDTYKNVERYPYYFSNLFSLTAFDQNAWSVVVAHTQIEESFSHFDGITRCLVIYKLGSTRERFFWERSRNKFQLRSEISDDVPNNERHVYNKPFHAEKYALRRLKMKIRKRHCPGYVKIYLNNSPCPSKEFICLFIVSDFFLLFNLVLINRGKISLGE